MGTNGFKSMNRRQNTRHRERNRNPERKTGRKRKNREQKKTMKQKWKEDPRSDEFEFFLVLYIVLGFFLMLYVNGMVNFILHPLGYRYVISVILISKDILKKCNDFVCVFNKQDFIIE